MAQPDKKALARERANLAKLELAVTEISRSAALRYFIRNLLGQCGVQSVFPADNALATARHAGRHEIGMSILATLQLFHPQLYPSLLMEEMNELVPENGDERSDRGEPGGTSDIGYTD